MWFQTITTILQPIFKNNVITTTFKFVVEWTVAEETIKISFNVVAFMADGIFLIKKIIRGFNYALYMILLIFI